MNDEVIEFMAEGIHIGWMEESQRQGRPDHVFVPGPSRFCEYGSCDLPAEKHHKDMLPYADLSEPVKNYDRVTARAAVRRLEEAGYEIVKVRADGKAD